MVGSSRVARARPRFPPGSCPGPGDGAGHFLGFSGGFHQKRGERTGFPDREIGVPDWEWSFPVPEKAVPDGERLLPDGEVCWPDRERPMPDREKAFPDEEPSLPDQEIGFPGPEKPFPDGMQLSQPKVGIRPDGWGTPTLRNRLH